MKQTHPAGIHSEKKPLYKKRIPVVPHEAVPEVSKK